MGEDHEFYGGIKSYDVHTYYGNEKEEKLAFALREKVLKDFAKEIENGEIRVYKFWENQLVHIQLECGNWISKILKFSKLLFLISS